MKSMLKAIFAIALIVAMIATFIACSNKGDGTLNTGNPQPTESGISFNDLFPTTAATTAGNNPSETTGGDNGTTAATTAATIGTTAATTASTTSGGGLSDAGADTDTGWGTMSP